MSRVTLARIAEETGVSVSTVSRVLRGAGEIGTDTRARILAAARQLGHTPGESRGRPRSRPAQLIDLVLGHFHDPYTDEVTAGARTAAASLGYDLVLTAERDVPDDDWPMRIRSRGSAGANPHMRSSRGTSSASVASAFEIVASILPRWRMILSSPSSRCTSSSVIAATLTGSKP